LNIKLQILNPKPYTLHPNPGADVARAFPRRVAGTRRVARGRAEQANS